jgi:hypothetical protein
MSNKDEFGMGEGKGKAILESCAPEDIDKIAKSNKDWLRVFAKKKFNHNLDCGMNMILIRKDLTKRVQVALGHIIDDPETDDAIKRAIERKIPRFLLHPVNKRVNAASPELLKRTDLIPCTENGKPLNIFIEQEQLGVDVAGAGSSEELEKISQNLEDEITSD